MLKVFLFFFALDNKYKRKSKKEYIIIETSLFNERKKQKLLRDRKKRIRYVKIRKKVEEE